MKSHAMCSFVSGFCSASCLWDSPCYTVGKFSSLLCLPPLWEYIIIYSFYTWVAAASFLLMNSNSVNFPTLCLLVSMNTYFFWAYSRSGTVRVIAGICQVFQLVAPVYHSTNNDWVAIALIPGQLLVLSALFNLTTLVTISLEMKSLFLKAKTTPALQPPCPAPALASCDWRQAQDSAWRRPMGNTIQPYNWDFHLWV